jgi:hypothetical protein
MAKNGGPKKGQKRVKNRVFRPAKKSMIRRTSDESDKGKIKKKFEDD